MSNNLLQRILFCPGAGLVVFLVHRRNPRPLGVVRAVWLCLKEMENQSTSCGSAPKKILRGHIQNVMQENSRKKSLGAPGASWKLGIYGGK